MPIMPRMSGKARKIVYSILGEPMNMKKQTPKEKQRDKVLLYQSSARIIR